VSQINSTDAVDGPIRLAKRFGEPFGGEVLADLFQRVELALDRLHRHLARYFARRVTTHAVSDDEQAAACAGGCFDGEVVFVPGPNHADVGPSRVKQAYHHLVSM